MGISKRRERETWEREAWRKGKLRERRGERKEERETDGQLTQDEALAVLYIHSNVAHLIIFKLRGYRIIC
jgi:hypothetical protein